MREKIILLDEECRNDVSSTAIRSLLRDKKSIKYLTPDPVVEYLERTNLYTHSSENLVSKRAMEEFYKSFYIGFYISSECSAK